MHSMGFGGGVILQVDPPSGRCRPGRMREAARDFGNQPASRGDELISPLEFLVSEGRMTTGRISTGMEMIEDAASNE